MKLSGYYIRNSNTCNNFVRDCFARGHRSSANLSDVGERGDERFMEMADQPVKMWLDRKGSDTAADAVSPGRRTAFNYILPLRGSATEERRSRGMNEREKDHRSSIPARSRRAITVLADLSAGCSLLEMDFHLISVNRSATPNRSPPLRGRYTSREGGKELF